SIPNLLPYNLKNQLSLAGQVPYNTVNGAGLRDQLISKAQKVSDPTRKPFTGKNISLPWLNNEKYNAVEVQGKVKAKGKIKDIDRRVYQIKDLDINRVDPVKNKTNLQLMKDGKAPYANDGTKINLHHLIQEEPGAMLELPESLHKKYSKVIHGLKNKGESFRQSRELQSQYDAFRKKYWKWRAKQYETKD
ncbi:HNH/ENDO VII family nuclease, partial [Peribacillus butanolivorans]|uniref:HNH/ENDO VII family nuclease n=1 Tax=Peribacillus butanolivorans TaxID=421767 RepID=UPI002E2215CD|nr:HNH/ENDO VII family nuclease [Peribacillus butanolivorans]